MKEIRETINEMGVNKVACLQSFTSDHDEIKSVISGIKRITLGDIILTSMVFLVVFFVMCVFFCCCWWWFNLKYISTSDHFSVLVYMYNVHHFNVNLTFGCTLLFPVANCRRLCFGRLVDYFRFGFHQMKSSLYQTPRTCLWAYCLVSKVGKSAESSIAFEPHLSVMKMFAVLVTMLFLRVGGLIVENTYYFRTLT